MRWLLVLAIAIAGCGDDDGSGMDAAMMDGGGVDSAMPIDGGGMDAGGFDAGPPLMHDCAATHFVTADADGSGDGSEGSPWTLEQAMAEAQPGNVVLVGPGVYTAPGSGERYAPSWNPAQSGTSDAPIVFCAEYPAVHNAANRSELRNDGTSDGGPTFGTLDREWIVWDGFYVNEAMAPSRPDTGPVVVWGSRNVTIARCVVEATTIERGDNHNAIRLEAVENVRIVDNRLFGVHESTRPSRNHAAIMTYDASFVTIEHNEIFDCDAAMYLKGDHEGDGLPNGAFTVRYNHVHDIIAHGVTLLGVTLVGSEPTVVSHNLFEGVGIGVLLNAVGEGHPASARVHHNTIVDSEVGVFVNTSTPSDFHITQNLVVGAPVFATDTVSREDLAMMVGNGYLSDDNHAHEHDYWAFGDSLEVFQGWSGLDGESSTGDPLFVDAMGGDYHLGAGSPALTASTTGEAVGCFVDGTEQMGVRPPATE